MKVILIIIISLSILCCKDKKNDNLISKEVSISTTSTYLEYFNDKEKIDKLTSSIKNNGDTLAYYELWKIYSLSGHKEDYLHISLFMANKYKYKQAYYDVYKNLSVLEKTIKKNPKNSIKEQNTLDKEIEKLKIEYLKKAAIKGHLKAVEILKSEY